MYLRLELADAAVAQTIADAVQVFTQNHKLHAVIPNTVIEEAGMKYVKIIGDSILTSTPNSSRTFTASL